MPLSEQEQRLLEEMERSLYHNDADFVATVGSRDTRPNYRMIVIGILIAIAGIVAIITGVAIQQPIIGVVGFVVMFGGVLLSLKRTSVTSDSGSNYSGSTSMPSDGVAGSPKRVSFMDRMNDRWDRRQDGQGH